MYQQILKGLTLALCISSISCPVLAHTHEPVATTAQTALLEQQPLKEEHTKKAILLVSTGTTYNDIREKTIDAIEKAMIVQFKDFKVYSVFSSQSIVQKIEKRDKVNILDVKEAIEQLEADGIEAVVVQPTYVMNGLEFENMKAIVEQHKDCFEQIAYAAPLLTSTQDYKAIAEVMYQETTSLQADEAVVYMGHGTDHYANAAYAALNYVLEDLGYHHIVVGTLESYPSIDNVIKKLKAQKVKKVKLMPFMIMAGSHANKDMAGDDEDSWKVQLEKAGFEVECVLKGLGEYEAIQKIYVQHTQDAINH